MTNQTNDREEFELFCDKLRIKKCVREYPCQRCDTWYWIETHTQKKVEETLKNILKHNQDNMTGLYDYDGIAQEVIDLVKK